LWVKRDYDRMALAGLTIGASPACSAGSDNRDCSDLPGVGILAIFNPIRSDQIGHRLVP
jgi:hypothetical protein